MQYTIQKLSRLAGVSTRTLRYYDEIGLLIPKRAPSGYRYYGPEEVDTLQQILFYKALGLDLKNIRSIITDPGFDVYKALCEHRQNLLQQISRLNLLFANVEKTILQKEGKITMTDKEKFEGFKQKMLEQNEKAYGAEIRRKYGEQAVLVSNEKFKNMTKEQFDKANEIASQIKETLVEAMKTGNPASPLAQKAADLHRQWLCFYWDTYSKEAHANLAQMYVDDPRFTAHYDAKRPGTAAFLRDTIFIYTGMKK